MALDALAHPRGPLPPEVYWRRRAVLVTVVVVVAVLLVRACGGDGGGSATLTQSTASPSPSVSPSVSPSPSPAPSATASPTRAAGQPCRRQELKVEAVTDAKTYAPNVRPRLTIKVTNTGPVPCTRDLGSAQTELRVMSGNDRVWSSDDCSRGGSPEVVTLQPRMPRTEGVTWARRRSAPGCEGERPAVPPGTYRLIARLGDITSAPVTFVLQ